MENVITVLTFCLNLATMFFNFLMQDWTTALLPIGCIVMFILSLVVTSSSGKDDK